MGHRVRTVRVIAAVTAWLVSPAAQAEEHALICASVDQAKELARIVDSAGWPHKIGEVMVAVRAKGIKCTVVHADVEYNETVETTALGQDAYDIIRVTVNGHKFFSVKLQKGDRA